MEDTTAEVHTNATQKWYKACESGLPLEGNRIHVRILDRFVTIFRYKGNLSCIDSICHHAGGPLTLGELQDIEDLNMTVVKCPWHRFMIDIDKGLKVYQGIDFINGKPVNSGWKVGKMVQRAHDIQEKSSGVYVRLNISGEDCASDRDTSNAHCAQDYRLSAVLTDTDGLVDI